jgi:undecaprenyl-diphosphatase
LLRGRRGLLVGTVVALAVAELAARGLQAGVGRARPPLQNPDPAPLVHLPHTGSFPSGHAATSFAAATLLALTLPRLALPAALVALAVAFSRLYVGVHYPLDSLAGAALGMAIGATVWAVGHWAAGRRAGVASRLQRRGRGPLG